MSSRKSGKSSRLKVFHVQLHYSFCYNCCSVKENKESALDAQNQLREEILGKLEDTNKNIEQVQNGEDLI